MRMGMVLFQSLRRPAGFATPADAIRSSSLLWRRGVKRRGFWIAVSSVMQFSGVLRVAKCTP
jgi:hypothetical protein